ncbi:glycosyltransferase family A protein [Clostridium tagluense]|uniref:glycosyltransferase family A protein n=1 Tax=Clostridium tagluense TaxID=360422 RepID=UPI001CF31B0C|nr:glycosyltransferase family 2 protein [Clostridium tagluense]MCB2296780.1 glycosyltransferase [Clostridium tagluense]
MLVSYPLVTSVVLCYKKFNYLFEAIRSILNQDYPCIELIISDDASENFPEAEIRDYIEINKKRNIMNVKIIINKINLGTVRNFNAALKAGSGEYYIGLSGDDVFYDSTVMRRVVERMGETESEILSCRRLLCTEDGLKPLRMMPNNAYLPIISKLNTPESQFGAFALGFYFEMASGSTTYFSKKHFERWGYFDESYSLWEDGPFYAQYTRAGNIISTAYDIIAIKYRAGGISGEKPSSLWIADSTRFTDVEVYKYKNSFKKMDRRRILYLYQRKHQYRRCSKIKKILFFIKYLDVAIYGLYYKYFCLLISLYESKMFKKHLL